MKAVSRLIAALGILLLMTLPAVAGTGKAHHTLEIVELLSMLPIVGVVTVNYFARGAGGIQINGSTTPPTAVQATALQELVVQVVMADSDTQALLTHNWGFDASAPTYFDSPQFWAPWNQGPAQAGGTYLPNFTFDITNTNVVKMNKLNFLGTGGTFILPMRRPMSASR